MHLWKSNMRTGYSCKYFFFFFLGRAIWIILCARLLRGLTAIWRFSIPLRYTPIVTTKDYSQRIIRTWLNSGVFVISQRKRFPCPMPAKATLWMPIDFELKAVRETFNFIHYFVGIKCWNCLPDDIIVASSVRIFNRKLGENWATIFLELLPLFTFSRIQKS